MHLGNPKSQNFRRASRGTISLLDTYFFGRGSRGLERIVRLIIEENQLLCAVGAKLANGQQFIRLIAHQDIITQDGSLAIMF